MEGFKRIVAPLFCIHVCLCACRVSAKLEERAETAGVAFVKGKPAADIQRGAAAALQDGLDHTALESLSKLDCRGKYMASVERDYHRLQTRATNNFLPPPRTVDVVVKKGRQRLVRPWLVLFTHGVLAALVGQSLGPVALGYPDLNS